MAVLGVPSLNPLAGLNDVLGADTHSTLTALIQGEGVTGDNVPIMVAIALAESGGKVGAVHVNKDGTQDTGIWQINDVNHGAEPIAAFRQRMKIAKENAKEAAAVLRGQGLNAWRTYYNGSYKSFLGKDTTVVTNKATATGAVGSAVSGVTGVLKTTEQVAGALLNPSTYLRIGKGLLGGVLVILGVGGLVFVVGKQVNSNVSAVRGVIK